MKSRRIKRTLPERRPLATETFARCPQEPIDGLGAQIVGPSEVGQTIDIRMVEALDAGRFCGRHCGREMETPAE